MGQPSESAKIIMMNQVAIMTALRSLIPVGSPITLALNMCLDETMRYASPEAYDAVSKLLMDMLKEKLH